MNRVETKGQNKFPVETRPRWRSNLGETRGLLPRSLEWKREAAETLGDVG